MAIISQWPIQWLMASAAQLCLWNGQCNLGSWLANTAGENIWLINNRQQE